MEHLKYKVVLRNFQFLIRHSHLVGREWTENVTNNMHILSLMMKGSKLPSLLQTLAALLLF